MAEITKSYTGHSPSITVNWSYDPSTKKAKVEWTCGDGYFKFHYFEFYIFMRYKKGKGDWPVKKKKIGGLRNPGDDPSNWDDIWANKKTQTVTIKLSDAFIKNQTQVAFGIDCSSKEDGWSCYSNFNGPTKVTGWEKINASSKTPKISLQSGYEYGGNSHVCTLTNALPMHWSVSGTAVKKMAMQIQEVWGSNDEANVSWVYSTSNPKTYTKNNVTFDDITINKCMHDGTEQLLLPCQWYDVTVAVGTASEKMDDQWEDDSKTIRVRTREESPNVSFSLSGAASTSATINWSAVFPTRGTGAPLYNLTYKLHDDTTNTDVTTGGIAAVEDASREISWGSFTITGLTIGHTYTITADGGSTQLDRIGIGIPTGCTFTSVAYPSLDAVWNMSDGSLIFGEPNDNASINIRVGSTPAGIWNISARIGIATSNGVWWLDQKVVDAGDNTFALSDDVLDAIYKSINPSYSFRLYVQLNYSLPDGTLPGYTDNNYEMGFKGNMKTTHIGISNTGAHRAKAWIGAEGSARRAIVWVGVGGVPRRVI